MSRRTSIALVTSRTPFGGGEAFVLREAAGLERAGVRVFMFPARVRRPAPAHSAGRPWVEQARAWTSAGAMLRCALVAFATHPLLHARLLAWTVATTFASTRAAPGSEAAEFRRAGLVEDQNTLFRKHRLAKNVLAFFRGIQLARHARAARVDHIHASWASYPATVAMVASKLSGVPWSFSAHRWDLLEGNALAEKIASASFARAISESGRRQLQAFGLATPVHLVHVGIDVSDEPGAPAPAPGRRFVSVGHLISRKNFGDVVQAAARLRDRGIDFSCEIVGDGPCRAELEDAVRALGLGDRVTLCGALDNDELLRRLRAEAWTAIVHPALHEGIPVAVMEAMAAGIPAIAYDAGDLVELVESGANGVLCASRDLDALTDAMVSLLASTGEGRRLGAAARATVASDFNVERSAGLLRALFAATTEDADVRA
jgi:glycosyltransferase involved in cell wall biosynthesis